jgi:uncharacterized protein YerC
MKLTIRTDVCRHTCDLLKIILRARRNPAKDEFFSHTTTHRHDHLVEQLLLGVQEALHRLYKTFLNKNIINERRASTHVVPRVSECLSTGNDGNLAFKSKVSSKQSH